MDSNSTLQQHVADVSSSKSDGEREPLFRKHEIERQLDSVVTWSVAKGGGDASGTNALWEVELGTGSFVCVVSHLYSRIGDIIMVKMQR